MSEPTWENTAVVKRYLHAMEKEYSDLWPDDAPQQDNYKYALYALSWDDTVEWCELLGLSTVPVLWRGNYNEFEELHYMFDRLLQGERHEGYVVRLADGFHYDDFTKYVGKYVRPHHVQPESRHWRSGKMTENTMKG